MKAHAGRGAVARLALGVIALTATSCSVSFSTDGTTNQFPTEDEVTWDFRAPITPRQMGSRFDDMITAESAAGELMDVEILLPNDATVAGQYSVVTASSYEIVTAGDRSPIGRLQLIPRDDATLDDLIVRVEAFDERWTVTEESQQVWTEYLDRCRKHLREDGTVDEMQDPLAAWTIGLQGERIGTVEPHMTVRRQFDGFSTYITIDWDPAVEADIETATNAPS
jgi:hypothetical protein